MSASNQVCLHRVFRAPLERVYRAFIDPDAMAKWLPPHGFTGKVTKMDAKVDGSYHMIFTNFTTGKSHGFGGTFLELSPEKIRYTDQFDDANVPGHMITTVTLRKTAFGTDVNIVQEGIPSAIPVDGCYLGWQDSLQLLAQLVDPEIPDNM